MGRNRSDVLLEVILDVLSDEYCIDEFKLETTDGGWHTTFKMNVKT